MNLQLGSRWKAVAAAIILSPGIARADVGDVVCVNPPECSLTPPGTSFCAMGVAFDGVSLFVNRCNDSKVYEINPNSGDLIAELDLSLASPDPLLEGPAGMSFDAKRNGLWIGARKPAGLPAFGGCCHLDETSEQCAAENRELPIYFVDLGNGMVERRFSIPRDLPNPASGRPLFPGPNCIVAGVSYVENDAA